VGEGGNQSRGEPKRVDPDHHDLAGSAVAEPITRGRGRLGREGIDPARLGRTLTEHPLKIREVMGGSAFRVACRLVRALHLPADSSEAAGGISNRHQENVAADRHDAERTGPRLHEERTGRADPQIRPRRFPLPQQVARDGPDRVRVDSVRQRPFNHGSVSLHEHRRSDGGYPDQVCEDLAPTRRHLSPP
jgi:hypothetical protein